MLLLEKLFLTQSQSGTQLSNLLWQDLVIRPAAAKFKERTSSDSNSLLKQSLIGPPKKSKVSLENMEGALNENLELSAMKKINIQKFSKPLLLNGEIATEVEICLSRELKKLVPSES